MSLKHLAISGLRWSLLAHGGRHVVQLSSTIVLVHLLGPREFGLMSMAMILVGFAGLFHELGTSAAVIQRRETTDRLLSTIFWVNLGLGAILAAALVAAAPLVAAFFGEPRVASLLLLLSGTVLLTGVGTVHAALLRRALAFRTLARVDLSSIAVGAAVGIGAAATGYGVWSLVYQSLAAAGVRTTLLIAGCPWRTRLVFSWHDLRSIGGYSLGLTGFNLFNYGARNLDNLLIGRFLGTTELGYYALAYRLMLLPIQHVSAVVGRVMFPVYARWQDDDARFRRAFLKVTTAIAAVTFPMMLGIIVVSAPLVEALFGPRWAPVAPLLVILAPVGLLQSVSTGLGAIYQAKGRTGLLLAWGVGAGLLTMACLAVGLRWGTVGVALGYAAANLIAAWPGFRIPLGLIGLSLPRLGAELRRPLSCSVAMGLAVLAVRAVLPPALPASVELAILLAAGAGAYALLSWCLNREQVRDVLLLALSRARMTTGRTP